LAGEGHVFLCGERISEYRIKPKEKTKCHDTKLQREIVQEWGRLFSQKESRFLIRNAGPVLGHSKKVPCSKISMELPVAK
jgi:hypothetical protein